MVWYRTSALCTVASALFCVNGRLTRRLSRFPACQSLHRVVTGHHPLTRYTLIKSATMSDSKFACDYAKRSNSNCKKCKQKLEKGELRVAKVVPNYFADGEGVMKQYHHAKCLFETFVKARATTKIVETADDVEGFADLEKAEKDLLIQLIKETMEKKGTPKKKATPKKPAATTPKKPAATTPKTTTTPAKTAQSKLPISPPKPLGASPGPSSLHAAGGDDPASGAGSSPPPPSTDDVTEKDNSFRQYRRLCAEIAEESSYLGKTKLVSTYIKKGNSGAGFKGDVYLTLKLLLPGVVKIVYNLNSKQLVKIFSQVFGADLEEMTEDLEQGDVAETIKTFFDTSRLLPPQKKSVLSLQEVDAVLDDLSLYTREDDQQRALTRIAKRSTANDLKMVVRLIKHDLRINAGAKHILDGLNENAYEAFKASRDLRDVVARVKDLQGVEGKPAQLGKRLSIKANLMTAVQPMLAEACKSIEFAFKRCPNGMFAEIKYDGERVQVHKHGPDFQYFSRSLKPVLPHKVQHFKDHLPKAFPHGKDLILDSEVLMIDTSTGKPLPFGTLGVHKKKAFADASVCLFVFDCLHFNGESLMDKPIKERRKILLRNMTEIPNHVMFSEMKHITEQGDLQRMMMKAFREGLEGLVLKDVNGAYEPGKRHWLKVKKDYLAEGSMADSADLVVLGAYFGTGNKGGIMSIFLMGVHDPNTDRWCTVTKCHSGFDDKTLDKLQKQINVVKIGKDFSKVPSWLNMNRNLVPDFVVVDPKNSPVWEITGAEFTKSDIHTAGGVSVRFPRCTKMRDDKSWKEATNYPRLMELYKKSKEYSDIPDLIRGKNGTGPSSITPVKRKQESEEAEDDPMDTETAGPSSAKRTLSTEYSPSKKPRTNKEADKPMCKYGSKCYQENPDHLKNWSHSADPPAPSKPQPNTSKHLPNVFTGMSFLIPDTIDKGKELQRFIIAFDGDVAADYEADTATHRVVDALSGDNGPVTEVTAVWVWRCIKQKKLVSL